MRRGVWRVVAWCAGGSAVSAVALLACVFGDPPPLQDLPPQTRPIIINTRVDPPLGEVITRQPTDSAELDFSVPIQIDPNQLLQWRVFVDFELAAQPTLQFESPDGGVGGDGTWNADFKIFPADLIDPTQCHVIEFDVASSGWVLLNNGPSNVAVEPPGGDRIAWAYQPTGNCNVYDAGPSPEGGDASDGGDDASDGATE